MSELMPEVVEAGEILEDQAVAQEPAELEPGLGSRLNKKLRVTEPRSINAVTHKVCNRCKQNLPAEAFCRQSNTSDGLNLWCKRCRSDRIKQWKKDTWQKNAAARKEPDPEKKCARCLEVLPSTQFFRDFSHRTGLEHFCKSCKKAIKTERLRVQREAALLGLPVPRKRKTQAEQIFPEAVPLPRMEEGLMEPACKLTSRKPTPKKQPTGPKRPYKKRKQATMVQPGMQAPNGLYQGMPDGSINPQAAGGLDPSTMPPEMVQAYLQDMQAGAGPPGGQDPSSMQPNAAMPDGMPGPASYQALAAWASDAQEPHWEGPPGSSDNQPTGDPTHQPMGGSEYQTTGQGLLGVPASQWAAASSETQSTGDHSGPPDPHNPQGSHWAAESAAGPPTGGQGAIPDGPHVQHNVQGPQGVAAGSGNQYLAMYGGLPRAPEPASQTLSSLQLEHHQMPTQQAMSQPQHLHAYEPSAGHAHGGGMPGGAPALPGSDAFAHLAPNVGLSIDRLDMEPPVHLWAQANPGNAPSHTLGSSLLQQMPTPGRSAPQETPQHASQGMQQAVLADTHLHQQQQPASVGFESGVQYPSGDAPYMPAPHESFSVQQQQQHPEALTDQEQSQKSGKAVSPGKARYPLTIPFRGPLQGLTPSAITPAAAAQEAAVPAAPAQSHHGHVPLMSVHDQSITTGGQHDVDQEAAQAAAAPESLPGGLHSHSTQPSDEMAPVQPGTASKSIEAAHAGPSSIALLAALPNPANPIKVPDHMDPASSGGQAASIQPASFANLPSMPITAAISGHAIDGDSMTVTGNVLAGQVLEGGLHAGLPLDLAILHGAVISNGQVAPTTADEPGISEIEIELEEAAALHSSSASHAGEAGGPAQSKAPMTGINPFTGQPYTYMPSK